jgi:peptidase M15-like protein
MQNYYSLARARLVALLSLMGASALPATSAEAACMPADLRQKLAQVERIFGKVQVISAHRPGARIAGSGQMSYHASCRAVDFNPPRGKYQQVASWLKSNHRGGVGTYSCGMHHIHIDTGPAVRFHKCEGGGQYASRSRGSRYAYAKSRGGRYAQGRSRGYYGYGTPRRDSRLRLAQR